MVDSSKDANGLYNNRYSVLDGKIQVPSDTNLKNGQLISENADNTPNTSAIQSEFEKKSYYAQNTIDIDRTTPRFVSKLENAEVTYNDKMTVRNIGSLLSARMVDTVNAYRGDDDLGPQEMPYIGFPGNPISTGGITLKGDNFNTTINNFQEFNPKDYKKLPTNLNADNINLLEDTKIGAIYKDDSNRKNLTRFAMYDAFGKLVQVNPHAPGLAMGQSKILNPSFQFNELDDVRSDFRNPNIGRMYSERIYDFNLPKVLFEVGTVSINLKSITSLTAGWFGNSEGRILSEYLEDESINPIKNAYMHITNGIANVLQTASGSFLKKHKMYSFNSRQKTYLIYVNEILIEIASWMELCSYKVNEANAQAEIQRAIRGNYESEDQQDIDNSGSDVVNYSDSELSAEYGSANDTALGIDSSGTYSTLGLRGSDTYMGLAKSLNAQNILPQWHLGSDTDKDYNERETTKGGTGAVYATTSDVTDQIAKNELIVPYAIQKGVSVSETFSNSTQEHPVMSELNSTGQNNQQQAMVGSIPADTNATMDKVTAMGESFKENGVQESISSTAKTMTGSFFKGKIKEIIAGFKGNAEVGMIQAGNARMILPEIWTDSSFDRSYSLSFNFFSPYGHRLSIFENTIVPLIFLICMTAPRQVGKSSYTTPFYIKAFAKGLFTTELGMVSTLSITRGEDKNDRTQEGFPRSINVTMSIKDLVPRLALAMDAGMWGILSQYNEGFRQYISYISNIDIFDAQYISASLQVYKNAVANFWSSDGFKNTLRWTLSSTVPMRMLTNARSIFHNKKVDKQFLSQTNSYTSPF